MRCGFRRNGDLGGQNERMSLQARSDIGRQELRMPQTTGLPASLGMGLRVLKERWSTGVDRPGLTPGVKGRRNTMVAMAMLPTRMVSHSLQRAFVPVS